MKRVKLGLLAVALFGAVAAFATKSQSGLPECNSTMEAEALCDPGDQQCCEVTENVQFEFDGETYNLTNPIVLGEPIQ